MNSPDETPQAPEDRIARRYRRSVGALALTLLLSWLLMVAPLPYSLLSGVTGLVALVLAIVMASAAWQQGRRSSAVMALVFGVPAALVLVAGAGFSALFYGPTKEYQDCMATALTEQAVAQCEAGVEDSTASWVTQLLGD